MLEQTLETLDNLGIDRKEALRALAASDGRLEKLRALLGLLDSGEDDTLLFVLQAVEDRILAYINQDALPPQLENALALMAASYYKAAGLGSAQAAGLVASVKRGDVQTSFAVAAGASGAAETFNLGADADGFFGWRAVLNEFRKLRW